MHLHGVAQLGPVHRGSGVRPLVWLLATDSQWGRLLRVAVISVLFAGLLLGMHWTMGEPR